MRTRLWITLSFIIFAVALPGQAVAAHTRSHALYRANWSHGLAGWKSAGHGFKAVKGVLRYSGSGIGQIVAPFQTAHLRNFAVDVDFRPYQYDPAAQLLGFGILVRQPASSNRTGILAGQFHDLRTPTSPIQDAQIAWGTHSIGGVDTPPTGKWQHYRLLVHAVRNGYQYSLMIDGAVVIDPTFITADRKFNGVGLWSIQVPMDVRNFRVTSLTGGAAALSQDTASLLKLLPAKSPGALTDNGGHFVSNTEYARGQALSVSDVTSHGRLLSDIENLSSNAGDITYGVASFTSPDGASWEYSRALAQQQATDGTLATYKTLALPAFGDTSHAYTYTFTDKSKQPVTVYVLDAIKGSYYFHFEIDTHLPDAALSLIQAEAQQVTTRA